MGTQKGIPRVHLVSPAHGRKVVARGRRAALLLARGEDLLPGHVAYARLSCTNKLCVNPEHCRSGTKAKWGKHLTESGAVKHLPSKCVASRKAWDTRGRKLTPEMVADIRSRGEEGIHKCAKRLGVSQFAVWSVDKQLTHRPLMRGASVFSFGG